MGFALIPDTVLDDKNITANELLCFVALARFADGEHHCFPSIPKIAEVARVGETTAKAAIAALIDKGYLAKVSRRYNETGPRTNVYTLYAQPHIPATEKPAPQPKAEQPVKAPATDSPEGYADFITALREKYPDLAHDGAEFYEQLLEFGELDASIARRIAAALIASSATVATLGWRLNQKPSTFPEVIAVFEERRREAKRQDEAAETAAKNQETMSRPCPICGGINYKRLPGGVLCADCGFDPNDADSFSEILALPTPEERRSAYEEQREGLSAVLGRLFQPGKEAVA